MTSALDRVFDQMYDYSKTMGGLHNDCRDLAQTDVKRFLSLTKDLQGQMSRQGKVTLALTSLSALFALTAAFIPKTSAPTNMPDPRLDVNGATDFFSKAMDAFKEKLSDYKFLKTAAKTASKFCSDVIHVSDSWFQGKTLGIQANRDLIERISIQDAQSNKSKFDNEVSQTQQIALRMLESKSKGA